jgi:hypothetical protein
MKKLRLFRWALVAVLAVLIVAFTLPGCGGTSEEETPKTAKLGFLCPLSGDAAGWGLPGLTGLRIWADELNAQGGMLVGDKRIPIEIITYDDQYVPIMRVLCSVANFCMALVVSPVTLGISIST